MEVDMISSKNSKIITDSVLSVVSPSYVFLFGSYAKNMENPESDMDICVVTEDDKNPFDIMTSIRLALFEKIDKAIDIVVYPKKLFDSRKLINNSFEHEIFSTGVKLYG